MERYLSHPSEAEAVVFDIDGVLVNSWMSIMAQGLQLIDRYYGSVDYRTAYQAVYAANIRSGDPRLNIPDMLGISDEIWQKDANKLMEWHAEIFDSCKGLMVLYPGAQSLIQELAETKPVAAFTTRSNYMFCPEVCPELLPFDNPNKYFSSVVTRSDVVHAKPHPEGFLRVSNELGIPPERMVMVGDMPTDMQFLRQVGALGIGITQFPFASARALYHGGADYVVESLSELRNLLLDEEEFEVSAK